MTAMAAREGAPEPPWDEGCLVTPLIGGYETMSAMVEDLESAMSHAPGNPANPQGHVYIADWRLDPLRDLSTNNPWGTSRWSENDAANIDQTAVGLILRLMNNGIRVRILLWYLITAAKALAGFREHINGHYYLARLIREECSRLNALDLGIVGLDLRVTDLGAQLPTASHHQKMVVIRVGPVNVAYCGGVDWAFTRRDAPDAIPYLSDPADPTRPPPQFLGGDWQSGTGMPGFLVDPVDPTHHWPHANDVNYAVTKDIGRPGQPPSDLPGVYGDTYQVWHDQHLRLEGPVVQMLEEQFRERWWDFGQAYELAGAYSTQHWTNQQVLFSSGAAINQGEIVELPAASPAPAVPGAGSFVQMWRTIPLRRRRRGPFDRGEFTVMAGISHACEQAEELIWIFDQYFWSRPLARLLNHRIRSDPHKRLCVIVVLPPYADSQQLHAHHLRKLALDDLTAGLASTESPGQFDRVGVFNLWDHSRNRGIYCHAKVQTYDRDLLVCGSANLNRRSFTCDTELDCAILDAGVVNRHQRRLWKTLFPVVPWPAIDFEQPGWGKLFLKAFRDAASEIRSYVEPDPWRLTSAEITAIPEGARVRVSPPKLPNGVAREQDYVVDYLARAQAEVPGVVSTADIVFEGQSETSRAGGPWPGILDPTSLRADVEMATCGGAGVAGRLDEIVFLIEACVDENGDFPYRAPP